MYNKRILAILSVVFLLTAFHAFGHEGKISGYMFGDYYWVAADHNPAFEDNNGFWFRRIYLTFDQTLSDSFDVRLRLEMNSSGDFVSKDKLNPFAKDAYLKWKHNNLQTYLGLSASPTWEVVEETWGYRSIEKTPLDLFKFGGSRDLGVALKGSLNENKVRYHVMFANGSDTGPETNHDKKFYGSLGFYPNDKFMFEVYADYEPLPGDTDRYVIQAFAALKGKSGRVGIHFARQTRKGATNLDLELVSVFGVYKLTDKISAVARFDKTFDPIPDADKISYIPMDKTAKINLFMAGLDIAVLKNFSLIPNVEFVTYNKVGSNPKPDSDFIPRLTFYYKF